MSKVFSEERIFGIRDTLVGSNSSFLKELSEAETHQDVAIAFTKMRDICEYAIAKYGRNQ